MRPAIKSGLVAGRSLVVQVWIGVLLLYDGSADSASLWHFGDPIVAPAATRPAPRVEVPAPATQPLRPRRFGPFFGR